MSETSLTNRDFKRFVHNVVNEEFDGNIFAYIRHLMSTIENLENTLDHITDAHLSTAA